MQRPLFLSKVTAAAVQAEVYPVLLFRWEEQSYQAVLLDAGSGAEI